MPSKKAGTTKPGSAVPAPKAVAPKRKTTKLAVPIGDAPEPLRRIPKKEAEQLLRDKLASSVIDTKLAARLGFKLVEPVDMAALGPPKLAFELPYFDANGHRTGFSRYRYLEDTRDGFARKTTKKALRYVQTKDSMPEVYLPPNAAWSEIMKDPASGVVITEGELKSACCTEHCYPCIGLGGVYSWKSTKRGLPFVPALAAFTWKGRDVVVAFDSDASKNPMVVAARNELCRELLALGALPRIAELPDRTEPRADGSVKMGLDDMVLELGPEATVDVLGSAGEFALSAALHELNAEVAYIKDPGLVVTLATGLKMRPTDFTGHAYSTRAFHEVSYDKDGNKKMTRKKAANAWLEWPVRFELERMTYAPGQGRITEEREYNTWMGWGCEPKKGDVSPWTELLDHLFSGHAAERLWFERWCALPLQQPGKKMYTASVMWGVNTGTGKSLVGATLGRIYGKNFTEIGDRQLQDPRNEWAQEKQFVMGDDVTGHDQRKHADRLKAMITQERIRIDPKYVPSFTIPDRINYLFTSNHPDAFFLEDDDRRFFVHEVQVLPLPREFYKRYKKWLETGGASHLFHHLLHLDLLGLEAEDRAPDTAARRAMVEDGLSDLGRWVRRLKDDPDLALRVGDVPLAGDLWSTIDLIKVFDPEAKGRVTAGGLGRELKRAGFKQVYNGMPVRTANGQTRLFAIRNADKWRSASAATGLTAHYDSTRGPVKGSRKF